MVGETVVAPLDRRRRELVMAVVALEAALGGGGAVGGGGGSSALDARVAALETALGEPVKVVNEDLTPIGAIQVVSSAATVVAVPSSATVVDLKAANPDRVQISVYNDSTSVLYLKCGTGASATDFTAALGPKDASGIADFWELPPGFAYTGVITGVWASSNGFGRVTEFV